MGTFGTAKETHTKATMKVVRNMNGVLFERRLFDKKMPEILWLKLPPPHALFTRGLVRRQS
jgi:hypothetical protein